MLTINKEFRKGILFVRLLGVLDLKTVDYLNNEITALVRDIKFNNVVLNISKLEKIDIAGINELLNIYNICKHNNGISLLCGVNDKIKKDISNSKISCIKEIYSEVNALELIKI